MECTPKMKVQSYSDTTRKDVILNNKCKHQLLFTNTWGLLKPRILHRKDSVERQLGPILPIGMENKCVKYIGFIYVFPLVANNCGVQILANTCNPVISGRHCRYLLLLISMLWHRQAIFESKGDKLSSSAECRIRTQGLRHLFASRLNACWQTDWAIEYQAKNLNSTARPYDQQAFSPLDLIASWLSHLALAIYMFVVVNFDALAQASDIRIKRRQVVFLCWMQDSNPRSQTPIRQQTECLLTNRLSYRGSS